jgi:hypothetical protein
MYRIVAATVADPNSAIAARGWSVMTRFSFAVATLAMASPALGADLPAPADKAPVTPIAPLPCGLV